MNTECTPDQLDFQGFGNQKIVVTNDAEISSSDAGLTLLHQIEQRYSIIDRLEKCFTDNRNPAYIIHSLKTLLTQRIYGICQGYEDINDHDEWRKDPLLSLVCGNKDGSYVAGKSTLNRLELGKEITEEYGDRYNKITWNNDLIEDLFINLFLDSFDTPPSEIILDFDATDNPLHGNQEGRFFHGYYGCYCYLPLYVFCGPYLLTAKLRTSDIDGSAGSVDVLKRLVPKIRERFPKVSIILRADSGFCREAIMGWCEANHICYLIGLPRNNRLRKAIGRELHETKKLYKEKEKPQKQYKDFTYKTRKSWSRRRRVIAKVEFLNNGSHCRFLVTNLVSSSSKPQRLYEEVYCARGNMENRIKEQQLYLFADRTSTSWMSSNQLRLWMSSFAYVFFVFLREKLLHGTDWAKSQVVTLQNKRKRQLYPV